MAENDSKNQQLRSQRWFQPNTMRAMAHRQRALQMGFRRKDFMNKPVIGIINTWSDLSTCHGHLRERANDVRKGVWMAGGVPVELPVMGLGEVVIKPTSMLYRNLLAIEVEENIRSHPVDGVVLMGGCDKTTVGLLMGAVSAGVPAIFMPAGPMLASHWRGELLGTGTHTRKYWDELRAGTITQEDWEEFESVSCRSHGTCNTMGTASTMTSLTEAMGLALPGSVCIPAVDSAHVRMATDCGERIVHMVREGLVPQKILTRDALLNAVAVNMALSGSTNAAIHLLAVAGRAGISLSLDDMDAMSRKVPVIANLLPSGEYLMEHLHEAGGIPAVMAVIREHLHTGCLTVSGKTVGENIQGATVRDARVIRPLDAPVAQGTLAVLRGNLAPRGAVMKTSAATPSLMVHTGKAVVFENIRDLYHRIDDPDLEVDAGSVLVLKNGGPVGAPGMPEWGGLPIPQKLLRQGVRDMVRISDARMSGTHFGTVVLHVCPEAATGGPLALVRNGDRIRLDVPNRILELLVDESELLERRKAWRAPEQVCKRGYTAMYCEHVTQADRGCDFDFLEGSESLPEPEIF